MIGRRKFLSLFGVTSAALAAGVEVGRTPMQHHVTLRREKGSPLTTAEVDDNFAQLRYILDNTEIVRVRDPSDFSRYVDVLRLRETVQ